MTSDAPFLDRFVAACASDELESVRSMFEEWHATNNLSSAHGSHDYPLWPLNKAFAAAAKHGCASVAKYLFQEGFRVNARESL